MSEWFGAWFGAWFGMVCDDWDALRAAAGPKQRRPFEENPRLFGEREAAVIFWRDNSAWCPYCCRLWLLLECMRLPYEMKTIPLARYLQPGEKKPREYVSQVPSGVVPALQFRGEDGSWLPAVDGVARLFDRLAAEYPSKCPPRDEALDDVVPLRLGQPAA